LKIDSPYLTHSAPPMKVVTNSHLRLKRSSNDPDFFASNGRQCQEVEEIPLSSLQILLVEVG